MSLWVTCLDFTLCSVFITCIYLASDLIVGKYLSVWKDQFTKYKSASVSHCNLTVLITEFLLGQHLLKLYNNVFNTLVCGIDRRFRFPWIFFMCLMQLCLGGAVSDLGQIISFPELIAVTCSL
jgi:hypothetical protein